MEKFFIFSPGLSGNVNAIPDIKLQNLASIDNSNVLIEEGEVVTSPLRLREGIDVNGNNILIPEFSFDIISVTDITDTVVFEGIGSGLTSGGTFYIMNSDDDSNPSTLNPSAIELLDSNDGFYTVDSIIEGGGNTTIVTVEDLPADSISGFVFVGTTNALKIKSLLFSSGAEEIFIFTKNDIYQYEAAFNTLNKLVLPYEFSDVSLWSVSQGIVNFGTTEIPDTEQGLIACNGVGRPLQIKADGTIVEVGTELDDFGTIISIANQCFFYQNYLLFGNVTLSTAEIYTTRMYRSAINDTANFKTGDTGFNSIEGPDNITGFGLEFHLLIVFKEESIFEVNLLAAGLDVFQINRISTPVGCIAPNSIINDRDNFLYFFGTDKRFKTLRAGSISDVIEKTVDSVKDALAPNIEGFYFESENRLLWSIPEGSSATKNNKLVVVKEGVWTFLDLAISAMSVFRKVNTDTWETLESSSETWSNIVGKWGDVIGELGNKDLLVSDYDGNLGLLFKSFEDLGAIYESFTVISTDLTNKQTLDIFKRIVYIDSYWRPISQNDDEATISFSRDNSLTFNNSTTVNTFSNTEDIVIIRKAVSLRGKSFRIKVSSDERFQLIGFIIMFEPAGFR